MPSPIAHSVSGYVLSRLSPTKTHIPGRLLSSVPLAALYGVFVSNLPDLDFLPQIVTGLRFHRGPSHSLLAAILVSALLAFVVGTFRSRPRQHPTPRSTRYRALFTLTLGIYSTHLLMDLFTAGGSGLPLLWPLSNQGFAAPFALFPAVHQSRGLLDSSHLPFVTVELLYALLVLGGIRLIKDQLYRRRNSS